MQELFALFAVCAFECMIFRGKGYIVARSQPVVFEIQGGYQREQGFCTKIEVAFDKPVRLLFNVIADRFVSIVVVAREIRRVGIAVIFFGKGIYFLPIFRYNIPRKDVAG